MNSFLNQYINSLGQSQTVQVASVLQDAIINQAEAGVILQQLQNLAQFTPLVLNEVTTQTFVSSSDFASNVFNIDTVIQNIFTFSNYLSLLISSLNSTLISQVTALQSQLSSLQTRYDNYSFLVADNNSYSYGYLEPFENNTGRDSFSWEPSDRTSHGFSSAEQALVNTLTDSLGLASNIVNPYPITPTLVTGNATALTVSDTGIQNSVTSIGSTGWQVEFAAAQPITAMLPGADQTGAQVVVEFALSQPSFASQIEIVPFSSNPVELVQVTVYPGDNNAVYTNLLSKSSMISKPLTIQMPYQSVARFRLLLNEPTYIRSAIYTNTPVQQYNSLSNQPSLQSSLLGGTPQPRRWNYSEFFSLYWKVNSVFPGGSISRPKSFQVSRGTQLSDILLNTQTKLGPYQIWHQSTAQENTISQLFLQQPGYYKKIFQSGIASYNFLNFNQEQINAGVHDPQPVTAMPSPAPTSIQNGFSYNYDLGLQYVAIGYSSIGDKGVFISTPVPAQGAVGEVRLNVVDENIVLANSDLDSDLITSTEYSVSNVSNPKDESNWTAICPVNITDQTFINAERFFPDSSGIGYLRFTADRVQPVNMYKNGYDIKISSNGYIFDPSNNVVIGVTLPKGSFITSDIFTVSYYTSTDFSTVTFPSLENLPLTSISDSGGAGEGFTGTSGRNVVTLSQEPYIDYGQVATSTYSDSYGMTPYQPITVIMEDGTQAINLTNYSGGAQANLSSSVTGYYYIQTSTTLMFNVPVTESFRAYYQYMQSSVRVRVVERCNYTTFATPTVNSFNLKAKLVKPNPVSPLGI